MDSKRINAQILFIWSAKNESAYPYYVSLGNYVKSIGFHPIFFIPSDKQKIISRFIDLGFRAISSSKNISEPQYQNWSASNLFALFLDEELSVSQVLRYFPWLNSSQIILVNTQHKSTKHFSQFYQISAIPEQIKHKNQLWLPIQAGNKVVSNNLAQDTRKKLNLKESNLVIRIIFGDEYQSEKPNLTGIFSKKVQQKLNVLNECIDELIRVNADSYFIFAKMNGLDNAIVSYLKDRYNPSKSNNVLFFDEDNDELNSITDLVWFIGTDLKNLYYNIVNFASVGISIILTDEKSNSYWVAADFAEETNSLSNIGRWIEKSLQIQQTKDWPYRHLRIQKYWDRYNNQIQGKRLMNWLGWELNQP